MSFNFYDNYYGSYVGVKIRGSIGDNWTYQVTGGAQRKYPYNIPTDPKTPSQLRMRDLLRKATYSWHSLTDPEKDFYRSLEPFKKVMSGFNYYVSTYMKEYI